MRSDLDVQTMLVASTAHVTEATQKRLEADINAHPKIAGTEMWSPQLAWEYGWIWHVRHVDAAEVASEEWPVELAALLNFAHEQGATWLRLDCDGERISGLPTWEW